MPGLRNRFPLFLMPMASLSIQACDHDPPPDHCGCKRIDNGIWEAVEIARFDGDVQSCEEYLRANQDTYSACEPASSPSILGPSGVSQSLLRWPESPFRHDPKP
jgi:hypothetical protein